MKKYRTFLKYTIFYIIFMLFSFSGLFFLIKNNLSESVEDSLNKQMDSNMTALCDSLSNDFIKLSETASQIRTDLFLGLYEYKTPYIFKMMYDNLRRYVKDNSLMLDIICFRQKSDQIFSVNYWATCENGIFTITDSSLDSFKVSSNTVYNNDNRLWAAVSDEGNQFLCYFPDNSIRRDIVFYILNDAELKKRLDGVFLPNISRIQILGPGEIFYEHRQTNIDSNGLVPYEFFCSYPEIRLCVWIDPEITRKQVTESLRAPYFILFLISLIGLFCFFLFIKNTYIPLKNFAESVYQDSLEQHKSTDIMNLGEIYNKFSHMQDENKELLLKVHNYRLEIQKSILGTITNNQKELFSESEIDLLFSQEHNNFFIVYLIFSSNLSADIISRAIEEKLAHMKGKVFLLEKEEETGTLLISGDAAFLRNRDSLIQIFYSTQNSLSFEFYISSMSNTIINFPRLYEEAMQASMQPLKNEKIKKVSYPETNQYPYQLIDGIQMDLKNREYDRGIQHLNQIFEQFEERKYPDFFIRSIYLDIITIIFDQLCLRNIVFSKYSDSYYNALYMCRSNDYSKKAKINKSILDLLQVYIKLADAPRLTIKSVKAFINQHYTEDEFSISRVSDEFQVSISSFSSWFIKEIGEKFVDYVWMLRFQKTLDLMSDSSILTKDIALQVGYQNYSSFSRKFKEHTGMSPSEYRRKYVVT